MASRSNLAAAGLTGLAFTVACLLPATSSAQYKVVGPDGRTTYTDRPPPATPVATPGRATAPAADGAAAPAPSAALPYELRSAAARYPVTLYASRTCAACDAGRQLLRQRGIPYAERLVADGDGELLQRLTGGREVPALTIGSQSLRGFSPDQWSAYLDAAGYPRQSTLPPGQAAPRPVPLAAPAAAPTASAAPVAPVAADESPPAAAPSGTIRF